MRRAQARRPAGTRVLLGGIGLTLALFLAALGLARFAPSPVAAGPNQGDALFDLHRVWTVHLRFTRAEWDAMQVQENGGPMGMPMPGGPGGPGGGRGGMPAGPASFIADTFLQAGDADGDGALSRAEFLALGDTWFGRLDANGSGRLDRAAAGAGLGKVLMPGGPGGPGGMPGPPGPPGVGGPGENGFVGRDGARNGMAGSMGLDFKWVTADLEFEGQSYPNVSVRYKGNNTFMSSAGTLKRSLKIDLNKDVPHRRMAGVGKINLNNSVADPGWMNEPLSYQVFREAGVPAPRTSYARVYLTVTGLYDREYLGLYTLVENEDNDFARDRFGTKKGAIFKPVTGKVFEDLGDTWSAYEKTYDPKTPLSDEETSRVIAFAKLVSHGSDDEFAAKVGDYLDLDEFARFMAATVWLSNMDSLLGMGQNYLVYLHPKTRQFQFVPWDLDHSFGQFGGGPQDVAQLDILHPWNGNTRLLERLFSWDRFKRLYLSRMKELCRTAFVASRIRKQVDDLAPILRPAIEEESATKLARFDAMAAGQAAASAGEAGPEAVGAMPFGPPGGPGGSAGSIKTFVAAREADVLAQLDGRRQANAVTAGFGRRGSGPRGRGGPGPMGGEGLQALFAQRLLAAFDANKDGALTREEFRGGFSRWFDLWDTDLSGLLTQDTLAAGIERDLLPTMGGRRGFGAGR